MEKLLRIKTRKWGGDLFSFDAAIDGWVELRLLWCRKLPPVLNIFAPALGFLLFIWILQERVIVALLRRRHRSRWGNLYLCGLCQSWRYILNLQYVRFAFFSLLTVVFLAQWFVNFFLTFVKASTTTCGYFHYVSYGILAHWFSLNQMFKLSCLVSLAHFPRFCRQYFSLTTVFSIHLARKTFFLSCLSVWIFLNFSIVVLRTWNQIVVCWKQWPFS